MSVSERIEAANKNKLCRNCLYPGHIARTCEKGTCFKCHQNHHTLLHTEQHTSSVPPTQSRPPAVNQHSRQPQSKPTPPNQQTRTANTANTQDSHTQPATEHATTSQTHVALPITPTQNVILSTALVSIQDRYGKSVLARALLDSCSQHCLMSKSFASRLKLDETPVYLSIQGIGSSQVVSTKRVTAVVGPRSPNISPFLEEMQFHVLPKLTVSLPTASFCTATWNLPDSALLADPKFFEMGPIDLIIGAEYYMELLKKDRQKATDDGPTLQDTVFGWIVSGRIPDCPTSVAYSVVHVCSTAEIQDQLSRVWEVETCQSTSTLSVNESACEEFFDRTTLRDEQGRFIVSLPKKERLVQQLGESRSTESKRFLGVEQRFAMNPELKKQTSNSNSKELLSAVPEGLRDERSILESDSSSASVKTLALSDASRLFDLEENAVVAALPAVSPSEIFGLRSSLVDLVRLTVYIRRFKWNSSPAHRSCRKVGCIPSQEYDDAIKELVKLSQQESFPQEFADIARHGQVQDSSRISSLNPQLVEGILCVGGRLKNAAIPDRRKHPYTLDHRHPFARIVVGYYHRKLFHAGQQQMVSAVREQFWPTSVRNLARQVVHECVQCFRAKPKIQQQLMADLPPDRVRPCSPFEKVGVDYCGPFYVVYPQRRARPIKCFVAVYVCLVTKAVHLELAADLTTQAFLATLQRFTSRRGKPSLIMCDNATNFVGAKRKLDELAQLFASQQFNEAVQRQTAEDRIEFRFIPARSPNFGGLWESAVKSFKTLFKRTIGTRSLVYDQMQTVLAQTEAILNSRPLTPISNDPDDFEALTPGHFLVQRPLTAIPGPDLGGIQENRLSAWEKMTDFTQRLWKKWAEQYLSNLHNRTKWTRQRSNLVVGTMVVLKEENLPPLKWQLARVTEVHPGSDGNIRVVTVRTKDGSYQRAISKICVLPIRDNLSSVEGEN